jgi:hypothetical protein
VCEELDASIFKVVKVEAAGSSETLVLFRQTTRRDIPELVILLSEFFSVGNPV